jgi:hypothetical protein
MTTNAAIARWLDIKLIECPLDADKTPCGEIIAVSLAKHGQFVIARDEDPTGKLDVILIADRGAWDGFRYWSPDTDIALWHGPDGILAEIGKKGLRGPFIAALGDDVMPDLVHNDVRADMQELLWRIRCAEPAQLAAALRKCFENAQEEK